MMSVAPAPQLAPILRCAELREIESGARDQPLMERAGFAAANIARTLAADRGGAVLIVAGPGNNGGDAFIVARWLRAWFYEVTVVFETDPSKLPSDAAAAYRAYRAAGGSIAKRMPAQWRG